MFKMDLDTLLLCPLIAYYFQFLFYVYEISLRESEEDEEVHRK